MLICRVVTGQTLPLFSGFQSDFKVRKELKILLRISTVRMCNFWFQIAQNQYNLLRKSSLEFGAKLLLGSPALILVESVAKISVNFSVRACPHEELKVAGQ